MTLASPRAGGGRALLFLASKLVLVFGCAMGVVLGLCLLLVRRVREHDAALGLATSKLDSLSLRSPSSLQELQRSHETFLHVFSVQFPLALACFTCVYVLKQTFAIPSSALLNVFAGAVLPLMLAFPLVCVLTACGASCCYLLSQNLASEDIVLSLSERLLPVPLKLFAPSVAVGLLPYNFITVHAGAMLSSLRSTSDLLDPRTMGLLVLLAVGMLIPALLKKKAKVQEAKNSQGNTYDRHGTREKQQKDGLNVVNACCTW
ncbi:hypothetical protein PR002_g28809 [Phytophthora rubi]|uniref:SNARE associated Golgi protein n=1 Tax=Phytophthora rubi TaxID=129364 RepID=A0A6A3H7K9_9STRA|nr:hypothetical protein PR002_g28809 [Phytophthora rubi]